MIYYHLCTEAMKRCLMFRDNEDYVVGVNYLAVSKLEYGLDILAFCLMSNHLHIVARGTHETVKKFTTSFKRRYSMWITRKYGELKSLKNVKVFVKEIGDDNYLKQVIAYVLRNPVAAGLNVSPFQYIWSSAGCYFARIGDDMEVIKTTASSVLSQNSVRCILKSKSSIPRAISFVNRQIVDMRSFVDYAYTESIFRTPKALMFYMSKDNDSSLELEMSMKRKVVFSDHTIQKAVMDFCKERFHVNDKDELSIEERCSLIRYLRRNFNSSPKQIARLLDLDLEVVKSL